MFNFNVFHFRFTLSFSKALSMALPKARGQLLPARPPPSLKQASLQWAVVRGLARSFRKSRDPFKHQQQKHGSCRKNLVCVWKERWQVLRHDSIVRGYKVVLWQELKIRVTCKCTLFRILIWQIYLSSLRYIFKIYCSVVLKVLSFPVFFFSYLVVLLLWNVRLSSLRNYRKKPSFREGASLPFNKTIFVDNWETKLYIKVVSLDQQRHPPMHFIVITLR